MKSIPLDREGHFGFTMVCTLFMFARVMHFSVNNPILSNLLRLVWEGRVAASGAGVLVALIRVEAEMVSIGKWLPFALESVAALCPCRNTTIKKN